jgi:hypothetical protein
VEGEFEGEVEGDDDEGDGAGAEGSAAGFGPKGCHLPSAWALLLPELSLRASAVPRGATEKAHAIAAQTVATLLIIFEFKPLARGATAPHCLLARAA